MFFRLKYDIYKHLYLIDDCKLKCVQIYLAWGRKTTNLFTLVTHSYADASVKGKYEACMRVLFNGFI